MHKLYAYLAAGIGALGILAAVFAYGFTAGSERATKKAHAELTKVKAEAHRTQLVQQRAVNAANERNRELESIHAQRVQQLVIEYQAREREARAADAVVLAGLRDGSRRLRLQVAACSNPTATPSIGPASSGTDAGGSAELTPETSESLWSIAADGDRAIRKLTALQQWAREAVELCNGGGKYARIPETPREEDSTDGRHDDVGPAHVIAGALVPDRQGSGGDAGAVVRVWARSDWARSDALADRFPADRPH
jgi:hypothetical protein